MTKGNFGKLLGILLKTIVHLQLSLLSLLPFLRAKHNDENTVLPPFEKLTNNSLSTVNCTENEIEHLINVLNINKASGDDGISHRMLKEYLNLSQNPYLFL